MGEFIKLTQPVVTTPGKGYKSTKGCGDHISKFIKVTQPVVTTQGLGYKSNTAGGEHTWQGYCTSYTAGGDHTGARL